MENVSTGSDDSRNSAAGSLGSTRPSSFSTVLSHPRRRSVDQEDSRGQFSHLRMREPDDDDATLQSAISQSAERSVLMPREDAGMTSSDFADEGLNAGRGTQAVAEEGGRGRLPSPQDMKARYPLELASSREPDEDMFIREVSGSNPPPTQAVTQGGEQRLMSPFKDKPTTHHLLLAPAREQGPEDLAGRPGPVLPAATVAEQLHDRANQHDTFQVHSQRIAPTALVDGAQQEFLVEGSEEVAQPGAYPIDGIHTRPDAAEREDNLADDLLTAQLVDPEADRLQLHREMQTQILQTRRELQMQFQRELQLEIHERRAQQDRIDKACCIVAGVNFSKRTNQVICLLVLALAVAALIATLFATRVVEPQSSAAATSPSMSNPPIEAPTLNPTPSPSPAPTPFPSPLPVTPAPIFATGNVAQWIQVGNDIDGESPGDWSGQSVALSLNGAVVAIGAYGNDGGGNNAGHVRVYFNAGGGWEQRGSDLDGSATEDRFGWSVSLSADGNILAVGARVADGAIGVDSGHVRVLQWISNTWQPLGSTLEGAGAVDAFGTSVALSDDGTILAVGALANDAGGSNAGHVRVFAWMGTDWTQRGDDLVGSSPDDHFGISVSLSSNGSILACGGDQGGPGYVRIYHWSGSAWQQRGSTLMGFLSRDHFGRSVSLSGDGSIVAVGADNGDYAVVYQNDRSDWVQIGQTIRGAPGNLFGYSVSLSFDGKTILIGGSWNASKGEDTGHALVFRLSPNEQWIQVGQELVGEAAGDWFGWSTSISDDGTRIAVGADLNDGNGYNAGHVRVYDLQ